MLIKQKNICFDTIHSEVNLLSSVYNINYKDVLNEDLTFITSSRPCINCANSIKTFNNRIKQE
jgi:deoxycytidylate deaminase